MATEKIVQVRCHSGYKGEEYPLTLVCGGEEYGIVEILEQSVTEDGETGQRRRTFLVKTDRGSEHRLIHLEGSDLWYCSTETTYRDSQTLRGHQ